jgi:hypothetical protein
LSEGFQALILFQDIFVEACETRKQRCSRDNWSAKLESTSHRSTPPNVRKKYLRANQNVGAGSTIYVDECHGEK